MFCYLSRHRRLRTLGRRRWLRANRGSRLEGHEMPITPFLDGNIRFDPEGTRVMGVAFEMVCIALRLTDRNDGANEIVARRIIELAKTGERNPDLLCEGVLKEFGDHL